MDKLQIPEKPVYAPILEVLNELMKCYSNLKELGYSSPIVEESIFKCAALLPSVVDVSNLQQNAGIPFPYEEGQEDFLNLFVRGRTKSESSAVVDQNVFVSEEVFRLILDSAERQSILLNEKEHEPPGEYHCEFFIENKVVASMLKLVNADPSFSINRDFAFKAVPGLKEFCHVI